MDFHTNTLLFIDHQNTIALESNKHESHYSVKVRAGKRRTYFFDVRSTKGDDYFVTLTESTKRADDSGYNRHKIFLYKEDFNRFVAGLNEVVDHVKNELMPDYDYAEFDRRQEAYEAERLAESQQNEEGATSEEKKDQEGKDDDFLSW